MSVQNFKTTLPPKGTVIDGITYFSLRDLANHTGFSAETFVKRIRKGTMKAIQEPGTKKEKFLVSAEEVRKMFLPAEKAQASGASL